MRVERDRSVISLGAGLRTGTDAMPLGRLGSGLALIYHDVVTAPLPPAMTALIQRLEAAMERSQDRKQDGEP